MKKFEYTNKLDWRNTLRDKLMKLNINKASAICVRYGYNSFIFHDEENNRYEFCKNGCGVCYGMIVLSIDNKNKVNNVEIWEA